MLKYLSQLCIFGNFEGYLFYSKIEALESVHEFEINLDYISMNVFSESEVYFPTGG